MVLMLSLFALPRAANGNEVYCKRRINGKEEDVHISPIHILYTLYMRGIDFANQLQGVYSYQVAIYKWWHKLFFFLLDTTEVNIYLMHKSTCECLGSTKSLIHLAFRMQLNKMFVEP